MPHVSPNSEPATTRQQGVGYEHRRKQDHHAYKGDPPPDTMAGNPGLYRLDVLNSMSSEPNDRNQQTRANQQPESNGLPADLLMKVLA